MLTSSIHHEVPSTRTAGWGWGTSQCIQLTKTMNQIWKPNINLLFCQCQSTLWAFFVKAPIPSKSLQFTTEPGEQMLSSCFQDLKATVFVVSKKILLYLLRIPLLPLHLQLVKLIPAFKSPAACCSHLFHLHHSLKNVSFASLWTTEHLVKLRQAVFNKANVLSDIYSEAKEFQVSGTGRSRVKLQASLKVPALMAFQQNSIFKNARKNLLCPWRARRHQHPKKRDLSSFSWPTKAKCAGPCDVTTFHPSFLAVCIHREVLQLHDAWSPKQSQIPIISGTTRNSGMY